MLLLITHTILFAVHLYHGDHTLGIAPKIAALSVFHSSKDVYTAMASEFVLVEKTQWLQTYELIEMWTAPSRFLGLRVYWL